MRYVVLGASAAGINGAKELRRLDPKCEIILISKDEYVYSRCILHHYMSGHRTIQRLCFVEEDFFEKYQIQWMKGRTCEKVMPKEKKIQLDYGEEVRYDKLLIATGSHTFIPPIKNIESAKQVQGFRNLEDMEGLMEAAKTCKNIIVIGAGLVGLDCATGFLDMGVTVTMVEMGNWMLGRQLDEKAAYVYQKALEEKGIRQFYGVGIAEIVTDEEGNMQKVILTDGKELPCDYLVVTAGVRSNIEFLKDSGIELSKFGLVYDPTGKTSDPFVYGAGDVSGTSPIWPVAVKEGIIAASNMAGVERKMTDFFASKSTMNFMGIPTMSLGEVVPKDETYQVEIKETKDCYNKIIHKDGKITGAILQGDLAYGGILQQLIAHKIDISKIKKPVFDIDYADFFRVKENFEFYTVNEL